MNTYVASVKKQSSNGCQDRYVENDKDSILICTKRTRSDVVSIVAKNLKWHCVDESDMCNINWTDFGQDITVFRKLKRFQRINHFPGMHELCKKNLLARNLQNMQKQFPKLYQFFPKTWLFPSELPAAMEFYEANSECVFILKPESGAAGNGITIVNTLRNVRGW